MLHIRNLHTRHGLNHALKGVSFEVPKGKIVALVGANGAGKSTLLGTIAGLYRCAEGSILLEGQPLQQLPPEKVVCRGISLVPERRQIFDSLTVAENLMLGAYHRRRQCKKALLTEEIENIFSLFPALVPRKDDLAGQLSGGMQQMLAIGRGLMARPKVLLLDEPSLGLAPLITKEIFQTVNILKGKGTTILLVEQNARATMKCADWVYVIDQGKIVLDGKPEQLQKDSRVQHVYMGTGFGS